MLKTKNLMVIAFALVLITMIGAVSAKTLIAGKIYNANYSLEVGGATVDVTCNGVLNSTTSLSDGAYAVTYDETGTMGCNSGEILTVSASHPDYGSNTKSGEIHDNMIMDIDLGVVNIPLVPEFGAIVGGLTLVSAIALFFVIRKN